MHVSNGCEESTKSEYATYRYWQNRVIKEQRLKEKWTSDAARQGNDKSDNHKTHASRT